MVGIFMLQNSMPMVRVVQYSAVYLKMNLEAGSGAAGRDSSGTGKGVGAMTFFLDEII